MTPIVCPSCGQAAEPGDVECSLCGRDLGSVAARAPQHEAPGRPPPPAQPWDDVRAAPYQAPPQGPPAEASPFPAGWAGEPVRYEQSRGPQNEPRRSSTRIVIALAVALLVVAAGAAGFLRRSGGPAASASTTSPSNSATHTVGPVPQTSEAAPPSESSQPSTGSESSTNSSAYPPAAITGRECGRLGQGPYAAAAAGNGHTTCPFAIAVRNAYIASGASGGAAALRVFSTATNLWYDMACAGDQPVTCTGGKDAVVFLYGGAPSFS